MNQLIQVSLFTWLLDHSGEEEKEGRGGEELQDVRQEFLLHARLY